MSSAIRVLRNYVQKNADREEGQGMVEYSLVVGTISIVIVAAFLTGGIQAAITGLSTQIATLLGG